MPDANQLPEVRDADAPASVPAEQSDESLVAILDRVADPDGDSRWDRSTKRTVLVIMLVALVFIFYISRPIIPMILIAAILAYLLNPIVNLGERLRIPRGISTIAIYLLVIALLALVPILFIPTLIDQLRAIASFDVPGTARGVIGWANNTLQGLPETVTIVGYQVPVAAVARQLQTNSQQTQYVPSVNDILDTIQQFLSATTNVVGSTATIGINVVGTVFSTFLAILVTFFVSLYMTMDAPRIQSYFHSLFPTSYRSELADLLRRIGLVWQSFLRGQFILSIVVGMTTWLALSIVGMPGALIFGILAGLLEVVPNLGPILAMIPAVITALIQGSNVLGPMGIDNIGFALITVGIYFLIQQLENNILVPRIIGDSINLHPIIVICAVAVGLSTAGILGALLAPPIVATFRVIGSYIHSKLLDYPPFGGRPLPSKQPRAYRRKVTGKELVAQQQGPVAQANVSASNTPATPAPTPTSTSSGAQSAPPTVSTEAQG
jgi:predicted PurR-regulated permease PerM